MWALLFLLRGSHCTVVCRYLTLEHVRELSLDELFPNSGDLVNEKDSLDMVVLMLNNSCGEARISLTMRLEVGVHVLDGKRCGARNPLIDTRDTESALVLRECILTALNDPSIDEDMLEARTLWEDRLHWVCIDD